MCVQLDIFVWNKIIDVLYIGLDTFLMAITFTTNDMIITTQISC